MISFGMGYVWDFIGNMMQIVPCENCGGTVIGLNEVSVNVTLSKNKWCHHCNQTRIDQQDHFFCSIKCFENFIDKNKIEWKT